MKYSSLLAIIVACAIVTGCAIQQNQAQVVHSGEVEQLVESASVLPGHTYYYTGPEAQPDVIIAIADRFTLASKYWIRVDNVAEQLKAWNRIIDNSYRHIYAYEGSWIMDPDGGKAGFWYSRYDHSVIRFPGQSSIIIYTPDTKRQDSLRSPVFNRPL